MSNDKKVYVASPRGFCAGVDRAIDVVELALEVYGSPVYVKHAIVHNTHVVKRLEQKGVIFTDEIVEIPEGSHVVFSAHGSPPEHYILAHERNLHIIDATCPLVTKVHLEVRRYTRDGYHILMIGHKGHVEPVGTLGNAEKGTKRWLIDSEKEARTIVIPTNDKLAIVTQTTLSLDETSKIMSILKDRFPHAQFPQKEDICYATTNRQRAVQDMLLHISILLVVGSHTSSNSKRLKEVGEKAGITSYLIEDKTFLKKEWFSNKRSVGVTSGASVPDDLVEGVVAELVRDGFVKKELEGQKKENIFFTLPHDFVKEVSHTKKGKTIIKKHTIIQGTTMIVQNS